MTDYQKCQNIKKICGAAGDKPTVESLAVRLRPLHLALLLVSTLLWVTPSTISAQSATAQPTSAIERMTRALPADPSLWQHHLNHFGQQGWDVIGIQPVTMGGLTLYLASYLRTGTAVPTQYTVLLSEFPSDAHPDSLVSARTQLEMQTNEHGQAGWQFLLSVTGQRRVDESFLSLVFRKPAP